MKLFYFADGIVNPVGELQFDDASKYFSFPDTHPTGRAGFSFTVPENAPVNNGCNLTVKVNGQLRVNLRGLFIKNPIDGLCYILADDYTKMVGTSFNLPRLNINGEFFEANGAPFFLLQCSDFNLFNRYQSGEDISPILAQRRDIGFNSLRVWTLFDIPLIGSCRACDYSRLSPFVELCASYNLYVEFTAYVQEDLAPVNHWMYLINALSNHPEVLLEYCNERHQPKDVEPVKSSVHLCSRGSGLSAEGPMNPVWDYGSCHWNDAFEWQRKSGHNSWEKFAINYHKPMHAGENTRFPDKDISVYHAYDSAAGCRLFNAGYCFHSVAGKNSTLWSGAELTLATETVRGAMSVDLKYRNGFYRNENPGQNLRMFSKEINGNDKCTVTIRY